MPSTLQKQYAINLQKTVCNQIQQRTIKSDRKDLFSSHRKGTETGQKNETEAKNRSVNKLEDYSRLMTVRLQVEKREDFKAEASIWAKVTLLCEDPEEPDADSNEAAKNAQRHPQILSR
jgi:hypothetical protein